MCRLVGYEGTRTHTVVKMPFLENETEKGEKWMLQIKK
jgi:hypothetical protein